MYLLATLHTKSVFRPIPTSPTLRRMAKDSDVQLNLERGRRIAAIRASFSESQAAFGDRFNVEQVTVSRWESGWPVAQAYWKSIAELAGVSTAEFFLEQPSAPLISWVAASQLSDVGEITHPADAPRISTAGLPAGDWFALRVVGNSMDRVAPDESVILVNHADKRLVARRFYVFDSPEGATFKRYLDKPARLEAFSTEAGHDTIFPQRDLRVIGRVGRVVHDLP